MWMPPNKPLLFQGTIDGIPLRRFQFPLPKEKPRFGLPKMDLNSRGTSQLLYFRLHEILGVNQIPICVSNIRAHNVLVKLKYATKNGSATQCDVYYIPPQGSTPIYNNIICTYLIFTSFCKKACCTCSQKLKIRNHYISTNPTHG